MIDNPLKQLDDILPGRRRFRKGMYLLPSLFTIANIAAGYYAILQALQGSALEPWRFDNAAKAIGIAVIFDGLDGRIARMTNTASDFGRELDSLADVITFGVAPAVLAWMWGFHLLPPIQGNLPWWINLTNLSNTDLRLKLVNLGIVASFIFLSASASRLARFNIDKNPQPSNPGRPGKKYFVGMPTPGGAAVIAAIVHFADGYPVDYWWVSASWCAFILAVAFLMVSTWRFPNFKDIDLRQRRRFWSIILLGALIYLIWLYSEGTLFVMALGYMLSGVLLRFGWAMRHKKDPPPASEVQTQE
ncbi:MAG TPA: phosphatidylcholine/phosphatidylserine synthase [Terriglobales bacterium]|jgi:CDP-diacylglycerol--serine O-phosphatidyltransferase|nr:phosphatidylcholine/phosphatidylserine synthase [Terriglobales bacterium]